MSLENPLRDEHARLGAAMGTWFGTALPADYGDFDGEYRRASAAAAAAETGFRMVAELTGADRVRYLNAVSSGDIRGLAAGQSTPGLLLTAQGHILAELRTLAIEDRLVVLSHSMTRERTLATLEKYIIMDDVTLADRTEEAGSLSLVGPAAPAALEAAVGAKAAALAEGEHAEAEAGGIPIRVVRSTPLGLAGFEILAERKRIAELWQLVLGAAQQHGGGAAGYRAIEALRLEAGAPWFGADFDDRVIPHEAGLEQSHISYVKGCYTGQEIVERVRSRGQVSRRRVGLAFRGAGLPAPGTKLAARGQEAGWVTSAAYSPLAGRGIGMGYLRREFRQPGGRVEWEGGEGEIIELPLPAGQPRRV